jgi:hypothetical protein
VQNQAKGSYYEAKDVTLGAKDRVVDDTKDVTGSAADNVNQGAAEAKQVCMDAAADYIIGVCGFYEHGGIGSCLGQCIATVELFT